MAKITYENKVSLNPQPSVANINKVSDADMNEIKSSVNDLYDKITSTQASATKNSTYVGSVEVNTYTRSGNVVCFTFTFQANGTWGNTSVLFNDLPKPMTNVRFLGINTVNEKPLRFYLSSTTGSFMNWYSNSIPSSGNTIEVSGSYITGE